MKNFLVIDSKNKVSQPLAALFSDLGESDFYFTWLTADSSFSKASPKKIFLGPELVGFWAIIFYILLPVFWVSYLFYLVSRRRKGVFGLICVGDREKIIFTPLASFLKIKIIWIELPGEIKPQLFKLQKLFSGSAELIVFTAADAKSLVAAGLKPEQVSNISLGVNWPAAEQQDNIFSNLAKADKPYGFYKNFTIGVVAEKDDRHRLEILLQAVKSCTNLIPNLRLVVIGQDTSSGNLNWLVKKLGLERRVWLVGEQKKLLQWFDDLDLYLILAENPKLAGLERALLAASRSVPLLGFFVPSLADIIIDNQTGFTSDSDSAETLAQKIIMIEADEPNRKKVGNNGQQLACHSFDRQQQLVKLREILVKT
jgi:glycosyltransferase involved in cell wall biosynthesis